MQSGRTVEIHWTNRHTLYDEHGQPLDLPTYADAAFATRGGREGLVVEANYRQTDGRVLAVGQFVAPADLPAGAVIVTRDLAGEAARLRAIGFARIDVAG